MTSQHYNEFWSDSDPHMKKVESGSRGRNITQVERVIKYVWGELYFEGQLLVMAKIGTAWVLHASEIPG